MDILLVVTKAEVGGAQNVVLNLARGLDRNGHDVTVAFGGDDSYLPDQLDQQNINWHRFNYLSRSKNPFKGVQFAHEFRQFLNTRNFDVVHLHSSNSLYAVLGSFFTSVKLVFTFHGMSVLSPGYKKSSVMRVVYATYFILFSQFLSGAIFLSKRDKEIAKGWWIQPQKTAVIPNGLTTDEMEYLDADSAQQKLSKKVGIDLTNKTIVGSIGRLHYQKNYEFLVAAAEKLRKELTDVMYIIIGGGPKENELRREVEKRDLEDTVHFVGAMPKAARFIPGFDVFTLVSRYEGLPITLLEALFAEVPMLVSDVGANNEVVADEKHSLFAPADIQEFANKLNGLVTDENLRNKLIEKQNANADRFTFSSVLQKQIDLYENL